MGGGFIFCALLLAGLPPLSGFIAKFAIIDALFDNVVVTPAHWTMIGLIILSGLATMIVMTRAGIDLLWTPGEDSPARLSIIEVTPIALLLSVCLGLMLAAGPVMLFMEATTNALYNPSDYISAAGPVPEPLTLEIEADSSLMTPPAAGPTAAPIAPMPIAAGARP